MRRWALKNVSTPLYSLMSLLIFKQTTNQFSFLGKQVFVISCFPISSLHSPIYSPLLFDQSEYV
jgi:hypothetical protein